MRPAHISIGVIIAVVLIFYWWTKDHPAAPPPVGAGSLYGVLMDA